MREILERCCFIVGVVCLGCNTDNELKIAQFDTERGGAGDTDSGGETDELGGDTSGSVADTGAALGDAIVMSCDGCDGIGGTPDHLLCAIDVCDGDVVSENRLSPLVPIDLDSGCQFEDMYRAVAHFGDPSNDLAPRLNNSYALLASGIAGRGDLIHSHNCSSGVTWDTDSDSDVLYDPWDRNDAAQVFDGVEWTIEMTAPAQAKAFSLKYVFLSAEFDDFISSPFNDKFYIILNAPQTTGGRDRVINYTECRDSQNYFDFRGESCDTPSGYCCYIAINSALSECCWYPQDSLFVHQSQSLSKCPGQSSKKRTRIDGTGFSCAADAYSDGPEKGSSTGWLQTAWPINGNEVFSLTFRIHDVNDANFDSQVIIDAFQFHREIGAGGQGTIVIE